MGVINRSVEIVKEQGLRGYGKAIKRYLWWHPVAPYFLFDEARWYANRLLRSRHQIVKDIQGHKMMIDMSLGGIHKSLYLHGHRELLSSSIFSKIIPKGARVVDVGANIGYYVLIEARKAQKIYAFEPEPRNAELLRKNLSLNSYQDRVEVYQCAVSDRMGSALLYISDLPNQHRLLNKFDTQRDKDIEVETITLDEFLKDKEVDVVRMDLEGAEWLVIQGMKDVLRRTNKPLILFLEVHPALITNYGGQAVKMIEFILDSGFKITHLIAHDPRYASWFKGRHRRYKSFEFDPPLGRNLIDKNIAQVLGEANSYHIFMERSQHVA